VGTADDDSIPVSQETFKLPRALLNWDMPSQRGVAGRGQRAELDPDFTPVSGRDPFAGSRAEAYAPSDSFEDDPTRAIAIMPRPPDLPDVPDAPEGLLARAAEHVDAVLGRAVQLWRDHPLRAAAIMVGVALIAYFAVDAARHRVNRSTQTIMTPAAAMRAVGPITVEQLSETRQPRDKAAAPLRGKQAGAPARASVGRRARETPVAAVPASKNAGAQAIAPVQPKSRSAERSSTPVSSSSAGLPAWGAEAVRDFAGAKSSTAAPVAARSQALTAKPAPPSAEIPPPVAAAPPAREEPKPAPVVAAKPPEPPAPVAPPPPSKPLTMEQMLNQVEEAAQAQRKKAGLKAPKTSAHDAELDALINGAMKKK
jgi:hypothetical protein